MRHLLVLAAVLLVLVALWVVQDRREIAAHAAGMRRPYSVLAGCASLLLAAAVYVAVVLWSDSVLLALAGAIATLLLLTFATLLVRALLQVVAPAWFREPPPEPARSSSSGRWVDARPPALAESAFGRPAPAFEKVGTWLSSRGNCRNTAWTPAVGPGAPRLAWRWNVAPAPPEYLYSIYGAPAVDRHGRGYVATSHGLVALDSEGKRLWSLGEDRAAVPALDLDGKVVSAFEDRVLVASPAGEASWLDCPGLAPVAVTVVDNGAIFVANRGGVNFDSGRMTALTPAGAVRWSVSCLRHLEFPPAVSSTGIAYFSSHDSIVWNADDPSSGYDRFQAVSASGSEIERVDANDEGYSQVWGTTAAMCLEDGTPVVGVGEAIRIGSGAIPLRAGGHDGDRAGRNAVCRVRVRHRVRSARRPAEVAHQARRREPAHRGWRAYRLRGRPRIRRGDPVRRRDVVVVGAAPRGIRLRGLRAGPCDRAGPHALRGNRTNALRPQVKLSGL